MHEPLDCRQLAAAVALGDELDLERTAARLGIPPSALGQLVGRLEKQLGFPLFDRSRRQMRITPEGERILAIARDALAAERRAEALADELGALRVRRARRAQRRSP